MEVKEVKESTRREEGLLLHLLVIFLLFQYVCVRHGSFLHTDTQIRTIFPTLELHRKGERWSPAGRTPNAKVKMDVYKERSYVLDSRLEWQWDPNIERAGEEGALFSRAYFSTSRVCSRLWPHIRLHFHMTGKRKNSYENSMSETCV